MLFQRIADLFKPAGRGDAALAQARAARAAGDFAAAREACQELLRDDPENAPAMALLAAIAADQRQFDAGVQWATRALAADRDCIPAHFAMGRLLEGAGRHAAAEASYRRVTELDPKDAKAQTNLGCMLHIQGRLPEAVVRYRRALELEPDQPEALRNYALIAGGVDQLKEALAGFERRLAADPRDAQAQHQAGHLYLRLGRHEDARAAYERAVALEPDQPELHFALAQVLLLLGRYAEGWREYEWRWRIDRFSGAMKRFPQPRWDGRPLPQGTLLLHGESGFGDVFQFVRYAALAAQRCARVVVECPAAQKELVAGVPGVTEVVALGDALPPFDAHLPLIAFPHLMGTTIDTIPWDGPYIHADPARLQAWRDRVAATGARGRKVGLVWTGDPANLGNRERSVTLQQFGALARAADASFFSLQKGVKVPPADVPAGMQFIDLMDHVRDFSDTAALLAQLDLVVTVDTSVAHLAGAMDVPTWLLVPYSPTWRYHVDRDDNPWYPRMRLFRQQAEGDWGGPLAALAEAFAAWAALGAPAVSPRG
jgi:tetratricopeptide (TPR) repeat protein